MEAIAALPSPRAFVGPMGRREVVYSSKIEQTYASVKDVALYDETQLAQTPSNDQERKKIQDRIEVYSNQLALEYGLASPLPICLRLIREMHEKLMAITGQGMGPGKFRDIQVFIGDDKLGVAHSRFVPPPPGQVLEQCLFEFEQFLHPSDRHPRRRYDMIVEIALAHYQFECIHPFRDGNGRLGGSLIPLWPYKSGVIRYPLPYLSKTLSENREEYYNRLLGVSTQGQWIEWIEFLLANDHHRVHRRPWACQETR